MLEDKHKDKIHLYGNPLLKKRNVQLPFTDHQVDEMIKCQSDIVYFLKNYVYIISLDEGRVLFKPYDYQIELLKMCQDNRFLIFNLRKTTGKVCGAEIQW